jgi:hypothetical protein
MNFVAAQPESLALAASRPQKMGVVPAAADVVSSLAAAQFANHGPTFQAMTAQVAVLHENSVNSLPASAGSYAATEAVDAASAR